jgi:hypothetical protein
MLSPRKTILGRFALVDSSGLAAEGAGVLDDGGAAVSGAGVGSREHAMSIARPTQMKTRRIRKS